MDASLPLVMFAVILLGVLVGRCRRDLPGSASTIEAADRVAEPPARVHRRRALSQARTVLTVLVLWLIPLLCLS